MITNVKINYVISGYLLTGYTCKRHTQYNYKCFDGGLSWTRSLLVKCYRKPATKTCLKTVETFMVMFSSTVSSVYVSLASSLWCASCKPTNIDEHYVCQKFRGKKKIRPWKCKLWNTYWISKEFDFNFSVCNCLYIIPPKIQYVNINLIQFLIP